MNKLLRTELFKLLIEKSKEEVDNNVIQYAYNEFIEQIRIVSNENDYSTTYRILAATRIDLLPQNDVYRINAEIGYWIGEPYWGKGFATDAVKQAVKFAFKELNLLRIYAHIYEYNIGSMKVLEKVGFEKDAIIKSSVIKEGKIIDEHLYSIRKV